MTHGSLFSGIGGFELAAEWAGWQNIFHCEWNDFGKKILKYYWPNSINYDDITKTDFTAHKGKIDILSGGFPCQPYSLAGKRKGKNDERHLWPEMLRAIREIQPRWVVGENVFGIVNWSGGLVFEEVQADLENEGYKVQSFILPACGINAPHRRERTFFVAYSKSRIPGRLRNKVQTARPCKSNQLFTGFFRIPFATHSNSNGQQRSHSKYEKHPSKSWKYAFNDIKPPFATKANRRRQPRKKHRQTESGFIAKKSIFNNWENFPTQSPICSGNDGFSIQLDRITFPKWRNETIKAYGNAVVPQLVYQIFDTINQYEAKRLPSN